MVAWKYFRWAVQPRTRARTRVAASRRIRHRIWEGEREFLALEAAASLPYSRFAFGTSQLTARVQELLFTRGVGEFVPPAGKLLIVETEPAGMLACLSGAALKRARLAAGAALVRSGFIEETAVKRRVQLAATTMLKPAVDDFYLSRLAVDTAFPSPNGVFSKSHRNPLRRSLSTSDTASRNSSAARSRIWRVAVSWNTCTCSGV
jgi:hypothetical protein